MSQELYNLASKKFDEYLQMFRTKNTGVYLPYSRLTDAQWDALNQDLAKQNISMIPVTHNGRRCMTFCWLAIVEEEKLQATSERDPVLNSVCGQYESFTYNGMPVFICAQHGMGMGAAQGYVDKIESSGLYYATTLRKTGQQHQDCMVIAVRKSDAEKHGYKFQDGVLANHQNNTAAMQRMSGIIGKPLTNINGTNATIKSMADFGRFRDRPIVLVTVGERTVPFYISSGSAGKTSVPAGKWMFFGGVSGEKHLRKGSEEDILSHYGSAELKQIATALDNSVGDLRDTTDILKTVGRTYLGGQGDVAKMINGPQISRERINRDMFNPDNEGIFYMDLHDVKKYLRSLGEPKNKLDSFYKSTNKVLARVFAPFKSGRSND